MVVSLEVFFYLDWGWWYKFLRYVCILLLGLDLWEYLSSDI